MKSKSQMNRKARKMNQIRIHSKGNTKMSMTDNSAPLFTTFCQMLGLIRILLFVGMFAFVLVTA